MAAGDITIRIDSETKAFKQGVEAGIIEPLEDAEKALKELGDSRGPEDLEKGMKDAQDATEKLADETKDTARKIEQEYRDTYRKVGDSSKDGLKDAASEAGQSGREAAASFSGEFEDVGDFVQETMANAFGGFGPLGAAAGVAAAVGLGAITAEITRQKELAEELKQKLTGAYQEAAEEGRTYLTEMQIQQEATNLLFTDRKRLQEESQRIGIDVITLARAYAGSEEDAKIALEAGNAAYEKRAALLENEAGYQKSKIAAVDNEASAIADVNSALEQQLQWHKDNQDAAQDVADLKTQAAKDERAQIQRNRDADQARYEAMAELAKKPVLVPIKADTKEWDKAVKRIESWDPNKTVKVTVTETRQRL